MTDSYGRQTVVEKTGYYGKDGHLWKRRTSVEKTDTYITYKKTGTYGKDGNKALKARSIFSREIHAARNQYYTCR